MCEPCLTNPHTHSFDSIGEVSGCHVFYTSFQHLIDYSNFDAIQTHIETDLARISGKPWSWIIDCQYLGSSHLFQLRVAVLLIKYLRRTHPETMRSLYLLNGGFLLTTALKGLGPFIDQVFYNSIITLDGTRLELFRRFRERGWTGRPFQTIMARLASEYN